MLSGASQHVLDQLLLTETTQSVPEYRIYMATNVLGESTKNALAAAEDWFNMEGASAADAEAAEGQKERKAT